MSEKHLLKDSDFVDVVDEAGDVVGSVPKHWDTNQLAPGLKKKGRSSSGSSSTSGSGSGSSPAKREAGVEPARAGAGAGSSTEEWVAYAREKGATEADLVDDKGEPLKQAALIEKYGTPPAS